MGGRRQLVFYHHQLRAAGQKPTLPRRLWRCCARRHEIQPRATRLALPPLSAHARSSARDHRLRNHHELKEKTRYVLMNPVRKRLCERAEDWVWIYRPNDPPPPLLG